MWLSLAQRRVGPWCRAPPARWVRREMTWAVAGFPRPDYHPWWSTWPTLPALCGPRRGKLGGVRPADLRAARRWPAPNSGKRLAVAGAKVWTPYSPNQRPTVVACAAPLDGNGPGQHRALFRFFARLGNLPSSNKHGNPVRPGEVPANWLSGGRRPCALAESRRRTTENYAPMPTLEWARGPIAAADLVPPLEADGPSTSMGAASDDQVKVPVGSQEIELRESTPGAGESAWASAACRQPFSPAPRAGTPAFSWSPVPSSSADPEFRRCGPQRAPT